MKNKAALLFAALLLFTSNLFGQSSTSGSLQGTITDATSAVVVDAKVTAREADTGLTISTTSNSTGIYFLAEMRPGRYVVTVEKSGFATASSHEVIITVASQAHLDLQMDVGSTTQSVQVSSQASMLQTDDTNQGEVIDERQIKGLPLLGRNAFSLVLLASGAQQSAVSNGTSADSEPRLSGGLDRKGEYLLDGASVMDPRRGSTVVTPNLDAVQEFNVLTTGIPAEYGRLAGGLIAATIKSGTNQYHGNLFEFYNGSSLSARNYFSTSVPHQVYNQFGGMVGGPIMKNRTFFFVDYQGTRNAQFSVFNLTLPTAQERQGDFSQLLGPAAGTDALGRTIYQGELFDPATTRTAPNGAQVRDPFPGNVIPANRFDSSGSRVLNLYPATTRPGLAQNFYTLSNGGSYQNQYDIKVDQQFSQKDTAFVRVSGNLMTSPTPRPYEYSNTGGSTSSIVNYYTNALGWTHILNPSTVSDARVGFLRGELQTVLPGTNFQNLGIPNLPQVNLPVFTVPGYDSLGDAGVFDPTQQEYQFSENLTLIRGRHAVKVGGDFRRFAINDLQLSYNGQYFLSANETASPSNPGATGNPVASLLLGDVDEYTNDPNRGRFYERSNYFGTYIQDDYKWFPNLTVSAGLRYDIEQQPNEIYGHGSNFDLISGQMLTMAQLGRNRIQLTKNNNFGPRFGFSWQPWSRGFVVRSSYGLFYTPLTGRATSAYDRWPQSAPFTLQSSQLNPVIVISQTPVSFRSPTGYNETQQHDIVAAPVGYFQQWNLDLQQETKGNLLFEASYVGSAGTHLYANIYYNEIPIQVVQQHGGGTQALRPYPNFANIGTFCECQSSNYNALELSAKKRYSNGLLFLASYTWSKFIDQQDDNFSSLFPQSSYDPRAERGLSLANIPYRIVLSSVYELPFGPGKTFAKSGLMSHVVGGWEADGILSIQSGQEVWIHQANNTAQTFSGQFRPNIVGNPILPTGQRTLARWFNTSAFQAPPPLTLGTSSKTPGIEGPGWTELDFGLHRTDHLPLTESTLLETRVECFNCFNHPDFVPPSAEFGTSTFGQVTSAEAARSFQVAAKLRF
jgi:hypothetical protein